MTNQTTDQLPILQTLKKLPKIAVTLIALIVLLSLVNEFLTLNFPYSYFRRYVNPTTISHQPTFGTLGSLGKNSLIPWKPNKDAAESEATQRHVVTQASGPSGWVQSHDVTLDANTTESLTWAIPSRGEVPVQLEIFSPETKSIWSDSPTGQESVTQQATQPAQTDQSTTFTLPNNTSEIDNSHSGTIITGRENCDLFSGEWVPNPEEPFYTNATCYRYRAVDGVNCVTHGRPNMEYLKWRWKPDGCELPLFGPSQFLELVRGKSLAFVGDSLGWNQMESLMCLLSNVSQPQYISPPKNEKIRNRYWVYKDFNFNVSLLWAPFLVNSLENPNTNDPYNPHQLYIDERDEGWTKEVEGYSYIIVSGGHWFWKPHMYYENSSAVGCYDCKQGNVTQMSPFFGYEKALRVALRAINSLTNFKGVTFLRTISPTHFEGGSWGNGADCARTRPFKRNETERRLRLQKCTGYKFRSLKLHKQKEAKGV